MAQNIVVDPPRLRADAQVIRENAKRLQAHFANVDRDIKSLTSDQFEGQAAQKLRSEYNRLRPAMLELHRILVAFANDLNVAADEFQTADQNAARD